MSSIFYRRIDDVPAIPKGQALYRANITTPIPDDDGRHRFSIWFFAASIYKTFAIMEKYVKETNEGLVVLNIEREEISLTSISLTLTKAEADQASWALDPMRDHASDDPEEGRYPPAAVPELEAVADSSSFFRLVFPTSNRQVPLDMLYRLEVQLAEMAQGAEKRFPRAARSLGQKIRVAFAVTEDESRLIARSEV